MADWFMHKGFWVKWLSKSPANRASRCDGCKRTVLRHEPRLMVDNDKGPERKRGKGKNHQYICTGCAEGVPAHPENQMGLFE